MTDGDDIFMDDMFMDDLDVDPGGGFDAWDVGAVAGIAGALLDGHARRITEGQRLPPHHYVHEEEGPVTVNAATFAGDDLDWDDFIGQEALKRRLRVHIQSARHRGVSLDHVLLASAQPGVGKTTVGKMIAQEMGGECFMLVPPFHPDALVDAAVHLDDGDILFIDEIDTLADHGPEQAQNLLHLMEEKAVYTASGRRIPLADVTVIGTTTDVERLPGTLVDRFPIQVHFEEYSHFELLLISNRFEEEHDIMLPAALTGAIARASRNSPRAIRELVMAARDLVIDLNGELPYTHDEKLAARYPTPQELLLTPGEHTPADGADPRRGPHSHDRSDGMSETGNTQAQGKYTVRILWGVPASSHEEAITKTLDQITRYGIMDWVYQSRSPDGDVAYLNGDLERIDIEGMAREADG